MWMLYAEQHWTKAIDLKSVVERLYEKIDFLEFYADYEAIYGIEKYYTVEQCEQLQDKYKIGRKIACQKSDYNTLLYNCNTNIRPDFRHNQTV
ncbi:hypothetical protein FQA39_LY05046 [Lamprigera yunnana]|nr:hypothetical protein FQA39_LY05046 [Lamprigera yunnana]